MANWNPRANDLFLEALELSDFDARRELLDRACGVDAELRAEVECLLDASERAGSFLGRPAAEPSGNASFGETSAERAAIILRGESVGSAIGRYKLLQQIGEGGMGTVYMAEQERPVRRKVAVKVIKPGMDSHQVVARFEAERQALALMDHVNIARVFDGGATENGRPYFVMELVHGVPITQYCDDNQLSPRQRLELFEPVCRAIEHAHQKGIIHRDIKPSNVMVTLHDGNPVPKVIDFGVAKATEQKLTERTLFTQYGTLVGTLEYMSPEQTEMNALGVDTRSDIYSLGVLLFELLTGNTPLSHKRVREAAHGEILRLIREEHPPRPSTRLSESGEELATISAQRRTEPGKLAKLLRGELDWILLKCLDKDRSRRYATASGLAADVQRYMDGKPIQACPPSGWYLFRKFAWRNKGMLASASAVILAVLFAFVVLALSNVYVRREQARTENQRDRAEQAQRLAQDRALEIQRGLTGLKDSNAMLDRGRWYVADRRWDDAHAAYTKAISLRPENMSAWVERRNLYTHLGLWDFAAADSAREIELREPDTTLRWFQHALLRLNAGDTDGYRRACRRMEERFRGTTRVAFVEEVLRSLVLAPDPDADFRPLVERARKVAVHQPWSSYTLYILGTAHYRAGEYEQAVMRLTEALAATDWDNRHLSHPILAMAYHQLGRTAESRSALDEAARVLDGWTQRRCPSPEGYWVKHQGADAIWPIIWWDWLACQLHYREAKQLIDGVSPPDDPRLHVLRARSLAGLRWNTKAMAAYDEAAKLLPQDPQIQVEMHRNRGYCHISARRWAEAAAEFTRATEIRPDDSYLWRCRAIARFVQDDRDEYRRTCVAMLERFASTEDQAAAGNVLLVCGLGEDAVPNPARLLALTRVSDLMWYWGDWVRGAALYRARRYSEAIQCFEEFATTFHLSAWDWCFLAMAHHRMGHADEASRCLAAAVRWVDEANARIDETNPQGEDDTTGTRPAWGDWHESVVIPYLIQEAMDLLKPESDVDVTES